MAIRPEHVCLLNEELNLFISGDQLLPRIFVKRIRSPDGARRQPVEILARQLRQADRGNACGRVDVAVSQ